MRRRSIVARGRICDPRHIELARPIRAVRGEVEVSIRPIPKAGAEDVFDVIAGLPHGSRSKADIDRQLNAERDSWKPSHKQLRSHLSGKFLRDLGAESAEGY